MVLSDIQDNLSCIGIHTIACRHFQLIRLLSRVIQFYTIFQPNLTAIRVNTCLCQTIFQTILLQIVNPKITKIQF